MKMLKFAALAAALSTGASATAFAWGLPGIGGGGGGGISFPSLPGGVMPVLPTLPGVPTIPQFPGLSGLPINFPGLNIPGLGVIKSFQGLPVVNMASATLSKFLGAPPPGPDPASYAPQVGMQFANALWGDQQVRGLCTFAGQQCGPALSAMAITTAQQTPDFRKQVCDVLAKVNHNVAGFSTGFNNQMDKDISSQQPSQPANADFRALAC